MLIVRAIQSTCLPADLQDQSEPGTAEVQQLQADLAAAVEAEAEKDKEVRALGTLLAYLSCFALQFLGWLALRCSICCPACAGGALGQAGNERKQMMKETNTGHVP